jgi:hypothetical protein
VVASSTGATMLLLQVIDTGPGLKGKDYRKLFDPSNEFGVAQPLPPFHFPRTLAHLGQHGRRLRDDGRASPCSFVASLTRTPHGW